MLYIGASNVGGFFFPCVHYNQPFRNSSSFLLALRQSIFIIIIISLFVCFQRLKINHVWRNETKVETRYFGKCWHFALHLPKMFGLLCCCIFFVAHRSNVHHFWVQMNEFGGINFTVNVCVWVLMYVRALKSHRKRQAIN